MTRRQPKQTALNFNYESLEVRQVLANVLGVAPEYWQTTSADEVSQIQGTNYLKASSFELYQLSMDAIRSDLQQAPMEFTPAAERALVFSIPNPTGGFDRFRVVEAPIMAPELAAQFTDIKTYRGQGIDDSAATVRLDVTPQGFHAQVLSPNGSYYVDPYYHLNDSIYMSYFKRDFLAESVHFNNQHQENTGDCSDCGCGCGCGACSVVSKIDSVFENAKVGGLTQDKTGTGLTVAIDPSLYNVYSPIEPFLTAGDQLFRYDLAVAATGEYTAFHGGTVALGQAAIVTAMNRINGVYEVELSIRMQLVANNSSIVYTNSATDPYSNNNGGAMLSQNQSNLDTVIGNANYDIGHVFSTGGGGVAGLGVVGVTGFKARGVTGSGAPINDPFTIDYVAHEIGHQFGANHTFNGDSGSCAGGNRNGSTAYELGSGSTIMAYAGICGNDDLQANSDAYFHFISFEEIRNYVSSGPGFTSAVRTNTGNAIPTVDAGINYIIPDQTPFFLTATGSDANASDTLTYNWEQRDLGPQNDLAAPDNGAGPLFRSRASTTSPTRYFPQLSNVLNNTSTTSEKLPQTNRNLNFRVTVRDNRSGGGGVNNDDMTVTVVNSGTGFSMTSQNTATNWVGGSSQTLTWNVSGTNTGTINTPFVDILFSNNGGTTFTSLAAAVPNDGSQSIVVPNVATNQGRIMIRGTGNIFFDINNANIVVAPSVTMVVSGPASALTENNTGSQTAAFTVQLSQASSQTVTVNYQTTVAGYLDPAFSGRDFTPVSGVLTFTPGQTSKVVNVTVFGDRLVENAEQFGLELTSPVNGTIGTGLATATIADDDLAGSRIDFGNELTPIDGKRVGVGDLRFTTAKRLGWQPGSVGLEMVDFGSGTAFNRDAALVQSGRFTFAVANRSYTVSMTFGDWTTARDNISVTVEGIAIPTFSTAVGEFVTKTLEITLTDGRVDIDLLDLGGSSSQLAFVGMSLGSPSISGPFGIPPAPRPSNGGVSPSNSVSSNPKKIGPTQVVKTTKLIDETLASRSVKTITASESLSANISQTSKSKSEALVAPLDRKVLDDLFLSWN